MANIRTLNFDAVIVGGGGSGMRASLQLARAGLSVAVLTKVFPTRSHTVAAQGGIGASLGNMSDDNWHYHFFDTIKGSDYLGDQDAIEFMCREAPKVVYELEHMGMPFDRNEDGTIYQRPFGGHTSNYGEKPVQRACAAADRTGHALLHTLYQQNLRAKTKFFVEWIALDLIRDEAGDVLGVTAIDLETGETAVFQAKCTLFATGGAGRIYAASTNAFINTGDGLGMAARAGIPLEDMEFWQFHPTGVAGAGVLLTEGCRGEGGILLNKDGYRYLQDYGLGPATPEPRNKAMELGPRDRLGKRRQTILQAGEIARQLRPDQVGARRQELADLDIGRAEPLDRALQAYERLALAEPEAARFIAAHEEAWRRLVGKLLSRARTAKLLRDGVDATLATSMIVGGVQLATHSWMSHRRMSSDELIDYLTMLSWSALCGIVETNGSLAAFNSQPHPTPLLPTAVDEAP